MSVQGDLIGGHHDEIVRCPGFWSALLFVTKESREAGGDEETPIPCPCYVNRSTVKATSQGLDQIAFYPRDLTEMMASSSSGILSFSRRMCTSTVLVVP